MKDMTGVLKLLSAYHDDTLTFTDFIEFTSLYVGEKKVVRLTGDLERLSTIKMIASELNFQSIVAPIILKHAFNNMLDDHYFIQVSGYPDSDELGVILVGTKADIHRAIEFEIQHLEGIFMAELYGYPICCGRKYDNFTQKGIPWIDTYVAEILLSGGIAYLPWESNRIGRLFQPYLSVLPDYFPCSALCSSTHVLAKKYVKLLEEIGLDELVKLVKGHLKRPVLVSKGSIFWLEGQPKLASKPELVSQFQHDIVPQNFLDSIGLKILNSLNYTKYTTIQTYQSSVLLIYE